MAECWHGEFEEQEFGKGFSAGIRCAFLSYGGAVVRGCAIVSHREFYVPKYLPGDMLFVEYRARLGHLERITIRRTHTPIIFPTGAIFNYVDTFNRVWLEDELISLIEAEELVEQYYDRLGNQQLKAENCIRE